MNQELLTSDNGTIKKSVASNSKAGEYRTVLITFLQEDTPQSFYDAVAFAYDNI